MSNAANFSVASWYQYPSAPTYRGSDPFNNATNLFVESFAAGGYNNANGFIWQAPNYGGDGDAVTISTENPFSGTHSLRFNFGGNVNTEDDAFAEQRITLGGNFTDITMEYMIYIPTNYVHRQPASASNNKFLAVYRDPYGAPGFQVNWSTSRESDTSSQLRIHPYDNGTEVGSVTPTQSTGFITAADRGTWVKIKARVKVPTGNGTNDGIMQLWKNDVIVCDEQAMAIYGEDGQNYFNEIYLLGWSNSGFTDDTVFFIDDIKFYAGVTV